LVALQKEIRESSEFGWRIQIDGRTATATLDRVVRAGERFFVRAEDQIFRFEKTDAGSWGLVTTPRDTQVVSSVESDRAAIRRVIASLETALTVSDVNLFLRIRPARSAAEEAQLRESFRPMALGPVKITVGDIRLDGTSAIARIGREVLRPPNWDNTFSLHYLRLEKSASGWIITTIEPPIHTGK
jgi:hypothetical protein